MSSYMRLLTLLAMLFIAATPVLAQTPNLKPGMWAYTNTTTIEGPVTIAPQITSNQECMKQKDLNKGVGMLNIPKQCSITKVDIFHDGTQFAASCNFSGITAVYQGHAAFHGDHLEGKMTSETDTPLGKMIMDMNFTAKRIGSCS